MPDKLQITDADSSHTNKKQFVTFDESVSENENKSIYCQINGLHSPVLRSRRKDHHGNEFPSYEATSMAQETCTIHARPKFNKDLSTAKKMEVGLASYPQGGPVATGSPDRGTRGPPRANLHVEFAQVGEMKERKEKYLTAKYGAHQMSLIRKRLGVEMWMYDQLQMLYQTPMKDGKCEEKELDLDELLDIEDDAGRKKYLQKELCDCKQSSEKLEIFKAELLERAKTL